jgi:XTP/dITP diphosphohydrolase
MTILLATNNLHKKDELEALLPGVVLRLPAEVGLIGWDHDETATTFQGNALGKARSLWNLSGWKTPVLADDSGICVDALGGAPGVWSARFGTEETGRALTDSEKNQLLLSKMVVGVPRTARFVCALALVLGPHREFVLEESWEGEVAREPSGNAGFGYDPVFWLPSLGCTSAELPTDRKNQLSHRYRASRRLAAILADLQENP